MTWRVLLAVGLVLLGCSPQAASAAAPQPSPQIVLYRNLDNPGAETRVHERQLGFTATHRYRYAVKGFSARLTPQQVDDLRRDPHVQTVVPDRPVHADSEPLISGGTLPVGIARTWAASGGMVRDAAGPAVAVVDTGIDLANGDLDVAAGTNCMGSGPPQDDNGHGTHVSGTIAALNNGDRVVGIAPGTKLYAVKVLGSNGSGTVSTIMCGLDWVTQHAAALGIKVVNMSLGGVGPIGTCASDPEHAAICRVVNAGVTVVAAAGNDGEALNSGSSGHVPGAYPEVLTVSAMADTDGVPGGNGSTCGGDSDDHEASFSNYGTTDSDAAHMVAAPGDCVVSLALGGGLKTMSGTSMATPHVAGAAALCIAEGATPGPCAGDSPAEVITALRSIAEEGATPVNGFAADPLNPLPGRYYGYLLRAAIPPTASTDTATTADHAATLGGTIDAAGAAATWWFEYGPSTAYGQATPSQAAAGAADPVAVGAPVTGLDSGTTYHYRVVMQTGEWTIHGADATFTTTGTPPPPPPDTQITLGPPTRSASGDVQIQFAATPAAGASFECRLDTATWATCTSPYTASVGEGSHAFSVRATNGKPDLSPATASWTVDLTPPDTTISGTPPTSTTSSTATFSFRASESPASFECRLDAGGWSPCNSPYALSGLVVGAHSFEVRATDAVGWLDGTPAAYDWVVAAPTADNAVQAPPAPVSDPSLVTRDPGAPLQPVARVVVRGPVRLDRRRGRVAVRLVCKGPGPCAGSFDVLIRGLAVARSSFKIKAGAQRTFSLRLGRQAPRALRRKAPRTAALSLTHSAQTQLGQATTRLLT